MEHLEFMLEVATPIGLSKVCDQMVKGFPMMIGKMIITRQSCSYEYGGV